MRRRIVLLVAATTSAVVVGFLVPMCLLIINLANDRAESQAREQAQLVAGLIASVPDDTTLAAAVSSISRAGLVVTVVRADEDLIGASSLTDDTRTSVQRARKDRKSFTATMDHGLDAVVPVTTTNGVDVVIATVPSGHRIVRGRQHDPEVSIHVRGQEGHCWGGQNADVVHVHASGRQTRHDRRRQELSGGTRIAPDHGLGLAPRRPRITPQDVRGRRRQVEGQLCRDVDIGQAAHTIGAEES